MENYFTQELIIAVAIALVVWLGLFIYETAKGQSGTYIWLLRGAGAVAVLLVFGLFSPLTALAFSVIFHSSVALFVLNNIFTGSRKSKKN